ncbi:MAG TPA: ketopantoate reductase family protein [Vicinamibacterales bacterium]|nr:ketopantoate reductase family protein [Vicinamibacterales bacterium]
MHIIVLGAGAIGTFYGARLSTHHDVTLVARPGHVDRITREGVRITGLDDVTVRVRAATAVEAVPPGSLILLTTKVYDTEAAIGAIVDRLGPDTCILCLQNGLYSEEIVRRIVVGRCPVLRGITMFGVTFVAPGVVALKGEGWTSIEAGPRSRALADLFSECRLDGRVSPDIRAEMWRKVIVNCVINPLTAMTGMDVGWMADERIDPLKRLIAAECAAVAERDGLVIAEDLVRMINDVYRPSHNLSSMHQDLLKGRRTEIDYLNGAVVRMGERYGLDCPVNRALAGIIGRMETVAAGRQDG